jgi:putative membrane protein
VSDWLPHVNALLNLSITLVVAAGYIAIRRGHRELHPRLMKTAIALGLLFVIGYVAQVSIQGHRRFPGDDWVRTAFVVLLLSHTILAVLLVPLLIRTVFLAVKKRFESHRRIAPWTLWIWLYVSSTGVIIYAMNTFLRPS